MKKSVENVVKWIYVCLMITSSISGFMFLICAFENILWFYVSAVSLVIFGVSSFLTFLVIKGYKLRYYFAYKKYKKLYKKSFAVFGTDDKDFKQNFIFETKKNFKKTGQLFSEQEYSNWIYSSTENLENLQKIVVGLKKSIKNKKGFVWFIENLEQEISGYQSYALMTGDYVSGELRFLMKQAYDISSFCLMDVGISQKFTEKINNVRKQLDEVYSPILMNFEKEVVELDKKLNNLKKTEKQ